MVGSHPGDKNKNVARVGHPDCIGEKSMRYVCIAHKIGGWDAHKLCEPGKSPKNLSKSLKMKQDMRPEN